MACKLDPRREHCNGKGIYSFKRCGCSEWCALCHSDEHEAQPKHHSYTNGNCWGGGWIYDKPKAVEMTLLSAEEFAAAFGEVK